MKTSFFDPPRPRLFAHRGSSADYPENTLPAFAAAVRAGIRYLELDVWATRDGKVVVHHDRTLRRTCGRFRRVTGLDFAELRRLDAGFGFTSGSGGDHPFRGEGILVPLLEEVLDAFPETLITVEVKQESPAIESLVMEAVKRADAADRILFATENDRVLRRLRRVCGTIPTSFSGKEIAAFLHWVQGGMQGDYRPPGAALQIPEMYGNHRLVSPETIHAAHAAGVEMHVWTVNEEADIRRLLAMGVDGVMSDWPVRLLAATGI
jgi:glycerophosphoryl diester phosphodiesterase